MSEHGTKAPGKMPRKTTVSKQPSRSKTSSKAATKKTTGAKAAKPSPVRKRTSGKKSAMQTPVASATMAATLVRMPMSVRWRDLDAFNHVNNSKYLGYLEEARLQWLMTLPGEWIDDNVAPVVAAAHVNYRRPIAWPNEIVVELLVERIGNTSLTIGHRITNAQDADVLYADGNVVMVWIDKHRGEAAALPDCVRAACTAS